jgi:colanic acid biosynthesis glycosyl transferase WcaI
MHSTQDRSERGCNKFKVTVWGINYSPEMVGIGPYNTALCRFLQSRGHSVRMVTTFPYYPAWTKAPGDRRTLFRTDSVDDVPVHRCWHFVPKRPSSLKRIFHEASFVCTSFLRLLFLTRPDALVVVSPPLLLGAAASILCSLKRTSYVFHVKDLQPDAAVGMGMLKRGAMVWALYALEAFAYRHAGRVGGITRGMTEAFRRKGVPPERIIHFPDGVRLPKDPPERGGFRRRVRLAPDDFLVVYSGNLGVKQGLEVLLEAAPLLRNPRVRILICGDGARREVLAEQVSRLNLTNVMMLPLQPPRQYEEMLVDADLSVITQQKDSGACFFPSKLLSCLSFGKPVLTVAQESSELVVALRRGCFGLNAEQGNPQSVAAAIDKLADDPALLSAFSKAGLEFVQPFDLDTVQARFEQELLALATETNLRRAAPVGLPGHPLPAHRKLADV